ncbi:flavin reductase family protein [Fulvivirga lutimaris]|uniref:flavin reductase family protein n=1 Tax=Fulvivirga lutimaris TaxID=1819566 RepID=UPI0012BC4355|nr:flavin reductase [Fulvivirga lutimaris]MTI41165.1 flavin oxidoreductase [Fulvivirga lutimaris]
MHLTKSQIEGTSRVKRLNIINSVTGIKPANLIGTISKEGQPNLAVFNSVFHLGSDPALMAFICRPSREVPRHTLENILENNYYTINAIPTDLAERAHYTSAKFDRDVNEFERCKIDAMYVDNFLPPFVASSPIKIGMKFEEQIPMKINGTIMIIGSIEHLIIDDHLISEQGYINLAEANIAGIGGLNNYYSLAHVGTYPYARVNETPNFE